ncbi:lipopolysaccharide biosynthesis protein [Naasia lichenicola]|uniref:Polysaccharide biosynthesis protein n=1 Tax=Naasia lichenicola TaxID=2565933 RepID=A0A4S4FN00_9MICO|nr:hypothetical protein [Naasia lichenicola]THG30835.1 hypothetical protein E6C64_09360 [Naasia lichenicola]
MTRVIFATVLSGVFTYVFLGTVSRSLDASQFDVFSIIWSVSLIIGFGLFLPVEQELSRLGGSGALPEAAGRAGVRIAAELALGTLVLLGIAAPLLVGNGVAVQVVLLSGALVVVSAVQFTARGYLLAGGRLKRYADVLTVDSILRVMLALVVALTIGRGLPADAALFAIGLAVAILLAHLPVLGGLRAVPGTRAPIPVVRAAVISLVGGTLSAQVLLNVGPLLIGALSETAGAAGAFQATFSVARIPLFMLVPLQAALVAPLAAQVAAGRTSEMIRLMLTIAGAIAGLAIVGAAVAGWLGPWIIGLVFGQGRALAAPLVALLVAGVFVHVGLVVSTQALIGAGRHRQASTAWIAAVLVFAATVLILRPSIGIVPSVSVAFAGGSLIGWGVGLLSLVAAGRAHRASRGDHPGR